MKILQVHNEYAIFGGEDSIVAEERQLLQEMGNEVIQYIKSNKTITSLPLWKKLGVAYRLNGSSQIKDEFTALLEIEKPDICHVHNVYSVITPIVYEVCHSLNVPVVQTLHNFRLICTNVLLFRNNQPCEECVGHSLYRSIRYKCFHKSSIETAIMAQSIMHHRHIKTWEQKIDAYICLTDFAKQKFIAGGLPKDKLKIRANFVKPILHEPSFGDFFLFVGRLEASKGIDDFIALARMMPDIRFIAIGHKVKEIEGVLPVNLELTGSLPRSEVLKYIAKCRALIFPSIWYEGMPVVILESFALGKPVVARNLGAMTSMIIEGTNGLFYHSLEELIDCVKQLNTSSEKCEELGIEAKKIYQEKYTPEIAYKSLMNIYHSVLSHYGS